MVKHEPCRRFSLTYPLKYSDSEPSCPTIKEDRKCALRRIVWKEEARHGKVIPCSGNIPFRIDALFRGNSQ